MSGKHWVTEPSGYLEPVIDKSGEGAVPAKTVIQVFLDTVTKHGPRSALALKRRPEVCLLKLFLFEDMNKYLREMFLTFCDQLTCGLYFS